MKNILQKCRFSNLKSITAKVFLTFAVLSFNQQMFAQIEDAFSDGDFVSNPVWLGNTSKFVVDSARLRLNTAPATDVAYLATASRSINDATWEFLVRLDFNPSTTNSARVYLVSNRADLSGSLNGYFVQLGNPVDDVSLYKQTGITITRVIDGGDGKLDSPKVLLRVKVTRDRDGNWQIYTDLGATGTYVIEGSGKDDTHSYSAYFGILCSYTSTRSDKFYFDDVSVRGEVSSDIVPPQLLKVEPLSEHEIQLTFSEEIDQATGSNLKNYSIDGFGIADNASLQNNDVILTFAANFVEEVPYIISISGVTDINGNVIENTQKTFQLIRSMPAQFKDVIITEVFADPSPKVSLPDVEFVEIFNRSGHSIDINQWTLGDGTASLIFEDIVLPRGEFLIVSSNPLLFPIELSSYGSLDFPSLNNSEDRLILKDKAGKTIDSLHYTLEWYGDNQKKEGGWSLELIDPENICAEEENWIASEYPSGGTPGQPNSVLACKPDLAGPALRSAVPLSTYSIRLAFNEALQAEVPMPENFVFNPPLLVKSVSFSNPSRRELVVETQTELEVKTSYSLTVNSISDCSGNVIAEGSDNIIFGLPEEAANSDMLINEVLFDPRPAGVDFVELVNVSGKFLNLKNWMVGNFENETLTNAKVISNNDLLLSPGEYIAFTEDVDLLKGDYPAAQEQTIFEMDDIPSLDDDAGSIAIVASNGMVIDHFNYSKSLHSLFIKDPEGVSLERISFDMPTTDVQNWKSCSTVSGYATPGYVNSNSRGELALNDYPIEIEPEVFIPQSGQPDYVLVHYAFDRGGYVANIEVMDSQGSLVKRLANNEILGTQGAFRWDGDCDDGGRASVGYYLVVFEVFDERGDVRTFFSRVAVATTF